MKPNNHPQVILRKRTLGPVGLAQDAEVVAMPTSTAPIYAEDFSLIRSLYSTSRRFFVTAGGKIKPLQ